MAQQIKLKRSAVAGRVPTTSSLALGEVAINTADGKLYFQRGDDTIQSFFTTNALITGSLQQSGSDSYFLSNVGIGTTSPSQPLTVSGSISGSGNLYIEGNSFYLRSGVFETRFLANSGYLGLLQQGGGAQNLKARSITLSTSYNNTAPPNGIYSQGDISGSGNLNIDGSITGSALQIADINYPTTDGTLNQAIVTDGAGNLSFQDVQASTAANTTITVKNVSGGTIEKGTPLYITGSGTGGNIVGVWPADASRLDRMPALAIAGEQLLDEAEGVGLLDGYIGGVDTSAFASGDEVFVAVGGGYTNVAPTGSGVYIQKLGNVEKVHPTAGSGVINGPNTFRALPNWETGKVMVGTDIYPVTSSVIHLDEANGRLGVGTDSPDTRLHISGGNITIEDEAPRLIFQDETVNSNPGGEIVFKETPSSENLVIKYEGANDRLVFNSPASSLTGILTVSRANRVGIAKTTPLDTLDVYGNIILSSGSSPTEYRTDHPALRKGIDGEAILDAPGHIHMNMDTNNNNTDRHFKITKDAGTELFRVQENGNVGIGTTSPSDKLDVQDGYLRVGYTGGGQFKFVPAASSNELGIYDANNTAYRLWINASGNVGIGNTTPTEKLTVEGNISASGNLYIDGTTNIGGDLTVAGIVTAQEFHTEFVSASIVYSSGSTKFGDTSDDIHQFTGSIKVLSGSLDITDTTNQLVLRDSVDPANDYVTFEVTSTGELIITPAAENVGINTNPDYAFHVYESTQNNVMKVESGGTQAQILFENSNSTDVVAIGANEDQLQLRTDAGPIEFFASNTGSPIQRMVIRETGNVGINISSPSAQLHISSSGTPLKMERTGYDTYGFIQSTGTGLQVQNFTDNRTEMFFKGDGTVGIGTTSPTQKLHVSGGALFEDTVSILNIDATNNPRLVVGRQNAESLNFDVQDINSYIYMKQDADGDLDQSVRFGLQTASTGTHSFRWYFSDTARSSEAPKMVLSSDGSLQLSDYGSGTNTGTPTYTLAVDSSGNIIEIDNSGVDLGSNTDVDTGTEVVDTFASGSGSSAFTRYVVKDGTNYRAGQLMVVWDESGNIEYTDVSTNSIGDTSEVFLFASVNVADIEIKATVPSDNWIVRVNSTIL